MTWLAPVQLILLSPAPTLPRGMDPAQPPSGSQSCPTAVSRMGQQSHRMDRHMLALPHVLISFSLPVGK